MKNIFGKHKKKENGNISSRFQIRKVSEESEKRIRSLEERIAKMSKKAKVISNLSWLASFFVLLGVVYLVSSVSRTKDETATQTEKYIHLAVGLGCMAIGGLGILAIRVYSKKFAASPEMMALTNCAKELTSSLMMELNVPVSSMKMDIIFPFVKDKNGKEVVSSFSLSPYINYEMQVFVENDMLCFADLHGVYALPLSGFVDITRINKSIALPNWNKETSPKDEQYKTYKIRDNDMGMYTIKPYYQVNLKIQGEDYQITLPNYELKNFLSILTLNVKDQPKKRK